MEQGLSFGPFQLLRAQKALLEDGKPLRLGSRALEILIALVERAGELVTKEELIAYAWPYTYVEDSNLRVHIAALRKLLGDGQAGARYIVNHAGRGYCFVAPVTRLTERRPALRAATSQANELPAPLIRMIGREHVVAALAARMTERRLLTIVGPGGIGKSVVALAVAEELAGSNVGRVCFVDLAAVSEPALAAAAFATALGLSIHPKDSIQAVAEFLKDKQMLVLLDNCEHVVEAAAALTEAILKRARAVHILATSREPLRAQGEWVHRLPPLEYPAQCAGLKAADAFGFPAIRLFVERARASLDNFELSDVDIPLVVDLCQRLDGIPLAIELTAARLDILGLEGLVERLDDRLLLAQGRCTALSRHQTLNAMLDWSHALLSEPEQRVLRRLAVFKAHFTLASGITIAAEGDVGTANALNAILSLTAKSLITADVTGRSVLYRLLHVTRAYAFARLIESPDRAKTLRRHAEHCCDLLQAAEFDWDTMARPDWLDRYGRTIDDIRAALDWAFSPEGDVAIGVALTTALLPLGFQLSLIGELREWVENALEHIAAASPAQPFAEMKLNVAHGNLTQNAQGPLAGESVGFVRAIELAKEVGDPRYEVAALTGLVAFKMGSGDHPAAVEDAKSLDALAKKTADPMAILVADRIMAQCQHFVGNHERACLLAERVLNHPAKKIPLAYGQLQVARNVSMRILLARIHWLWGYCERAVRLANECIEYAASDGPYALCQALALAACPIALWRGDDAAARDLVARLTEQAARYTLGHWNSWAQGYATILANRGRTNGAHMTTASSGALQADTLVTFDAGLLNAETIARAEKGTAGWCSPEILRAKGERVLKENGPGAAGDAEGIFFRSLEAARQQGALMWELRTSISLARLWRQAGRLAEADDILGTTYARFSEGFRTADLVNAEAELEALRSPTLVAATPTRRSASAC